jgi:hypothetical protein
VWEVDYDDTGGIWKGKNDGNRVEGWLLAYFSMLFERVLREIERITWTIDYHRSS